MTVDALVLDGIDSGHRDAGQVPSPFLFDPEALSRSCRGGADARRRWRNSVLAIARKMLVEDGYRGLTIRKLASRTNSSAQNIYNNIGSKDDVILQALLSYNDVILDREKSCNPYIKCIMARHAEVTGHPDYAKAVYEALFSNAYIASAVQADIIKRIAPFIRSELTRNNSDAVSYMRLSKLLATIARNSAREWLDENCSAQDMLENALTDGELCLLGALSKRKAGWASSIALEY